MIFANFKKITGIKIFPILGNNVITTFRTKVHGTKKGTENYEEKICASLNYTNLSSTFLPHEKSPKNRLKFMKNTLPLKGTSVQKHYRLEIISTL